MPRELLWKLESKIPAFNRPVNLVEIFEKQKFCHEDFVAAGAALGIGESR
jgi:hypothetical protein